MRNDDDQPRTRSGEPDPEAIEPEVDPDSPRRVEQERPEPAHGASRFDAGTGQGTVSGPPYEYELQERPILDGSTMNPAAEASVPNPYRGQDDPSAMHSQPALHTTNTNRWLFASVVAGVIVTVVLLLLLPWSPVWCSVGVAVALVGLLLVLAVRASSLRRPARLRVEAVLLWIIWLVPLAIIVTVLLTSAGEIWDVAR
jgi:hypothetical protein